MAIFDWTDYHPHSSQKWVLYTEEHSDIRAKCKTIAPYSGLVYDGKLEIYIMTLTRNLPNSETNWKTAIEGLGFKYIGEAYCGALLVYFKPQNNFT